MSTAAGMKESGEGVRCSGHNPGAPRRETGLARPSASENYSWPGLYRFPNSAGPYVENLGMPGWATSDD